MRVLSKTDIKNYLTELDNWILDDDAIKREWIFRDFAEAMDFINMIAVIAEAKNHHPEIINVYNQVSLRFKTHDVDGITDKDINIAREIDKL